MSVTQHGQTPLGERTGVGVLIVDDAACFRDSARELLEHRGYAVVGEADSTKSARRAVAELRPDAVLLDVNLPDGNGFELAAVFAESHPELAILLVSADGDPGRSPADVSARGFVEKSRLALVDLATFWPAP